MQKAKCLPVPNKYILNNFTSCKIYQTSADRTVHVLSMSCPCLVFVRIFRKIVSDVCLLSGIQDSGYSVRLLDSGICLSRLYGRKRTRQSCPDFYCPCPPTSGFYCVCVRVSAKDSSRTGSRSETLALIVDLSLTHLWPEIWPWKSLWSDDQSLFTFLRHSMI